MKQVHLYIIYFGLDKIALNYRNMICNRSDRHERIFPLALLLFFRRTDCDTKYRMLMKTSKCSSVALPFTLLKSDVTRRDHVSVVMDAGSRIVNFIVNFIRDGTVFAYL